MWAAVSGSTPGAAWAASEGSAPLELVQRFREAVARRSAGEPQAYAVGLAGFRMLDLVVDRRVLIPRPETEGLVDRVLAWAGERWGSGTGNGEQGTVRPVAGPFPVPGSPLPDSRCRSWGSVLDLGTGSGCIALSLAVEGAFTRIVATDVSADALAVAASNTEQTEAAARVELRHGSLFDPVAGERFDVIVSNPPYLTTGELARLDPSVREFEPAIALAGGADGLDQTRDTLRSARDHLTVGGLLAMEVDCHRSALVLAEARAGGWEDARIEKDWWGRERYLLATKN